MAKVSRKKQIITESKLKQWIDTKKNVLFVGKHGVGKTSIVKQAFEDAGLSYKIYSCATLDPWVDFIGVPEKQIDENGNTYLSLVRPKEWEDDLPPYPILDVIVKEYIEDFVNFYSKFSLRGNISEKDYQRMIDKINFNEYKRRQAAPCIKVSKMAFGTGRRIPIVKGKMKV